MDIYEILDILNINYKEEKHEKVYTVEEAVNADISLDGIGCKNLFLKDKHNYYLVLMLDSKKCDLKELSNDLNVKKGDVIENINIYTLVGINKKGIRQLVGIYQDRPLNNRYWLDIFESLKTIHRFKII